MRFVKRVKRFVCRVYTAVRLVICRRDLPRNPRWREQGYPYPNCWEIDEFFGEAARAGRGSTLHMEARRVFWEAYWRLLGRYRGGKPFFEVYIGEDTSLRRLEDREDWVLKNIIVSAITHGIVPEEARMYTYKVYREIYGPLTGQQA